MRRSIFTAGYSVLGWNHPGFSGSTGRPYPDQATFPFSKTQTCFKLWFCFLGVGSSGCCDAVCHSQTGFPSREHSCLRMVHRYVMDGPSVCNGKFDRLEQTFPGGFTSSWLAMNYPGIRGLILDATFDHLEPLAIPRYI